MNTLLPLDTSNYISVVTCTKGLTNNICLSIEADIALAKLKGIEVFMYYHDYREWAWFKTSDITKAEELFTKDKGDDIAEDEMGWSNDYSPSFNTKEQRCDPHLALVVEQYETGGNYKIHRLPKHWNFDIITIMRRLTVAANR